MAINTMTPGEGLDLDNPNQQVKQDGPVECLGKTFTNDAERREHFLAILAEKLKDPEFRKIEGFPIGEDDAILELSDPPYYTACPNPFIEDFITHYGRPYDPTEVYKREPYAADVSEGKNDPIYNAHTYHTKVPHKAIMRYILHYTNPGDVIFDGFCGTGMTGVAAQMCGDKLAVEALGYKVLADGTVLSEEKDDEGSSEWLPISMLGQRNAVLNDLSPIATFIAYNYNTRVDVAELGNAGSQLIGKVKDKIGWSYKTDHKKGESKLGEINFTLFSDVFSCPHCANEFNFYDLAVDRVNKKVKDKFLCDSCGSELNKKNIEKVNTIRINHRTGEQYSVAKVVPVLVNYEFEGKKFIKSPSVFDFDIVDKTKEDIVGVYTPDVLMMHKGEKWGDSWRSGYHAGFKYASDFYTERELNSLAVIWDESRGIDDRRVSNTLRLVHSAINLNCSKMRRFRPDGKGGGPLAGTLYVSSLTTPPNVLKTYKRNLDTMLGALNSLGSLESTSVINSGSATALDIIPDNSIDYVFLDPPFGGNLMYSELNFLWESWLKVWTAIENEAIENKSQNKGASEYRELMQLCFSEAYRVMKPGRWMTVEFSNTQASVWNSIQESLAKAGFIVANVSALDKKQGSYKAVVSPTAVKQDLVISVYKPNGGFEDRFVSESDEDGVWDFVRTHLGYLPVVKRQSGEMVKIPERDPRILFDQVIAYFVRNFRDVPLSSIAFQAGLKERFAERDGMVFLPNQVSEYDKTRITNKQLKQLNIFVDDEASAIDWLRQLLSEKPQTYQDIHPKFINELSGWKKAEEQLELSKLLEQNFLNYDGVGQLPPQIHSYLSTNFKEMRNLAKDDQQLIKKAKDRWYVPNPEREEDLQKLRDRDLFKQFSEYKAHSGSKLKTVRLEAVRCGFKKAWQERDYKTIIHVAEKIPQNLLQEDQKLLMWYDQAQTRASDESMF